MKHWNTLDGIKVHLHQIGVNWTWSATLTCKRLWHLRCKMVSPREVSRQDGEHTIQLNGLRFGTDFVFFFHWLSGWHRPEFLIKSCAIWSVIAFMWTNSSSTENSWYICLILSRMIVNKTSIDCTPSSDCHNNKESQFSETLFQRLCPTLFDIPCSRNAVQFNYYHSHFGDIQTSRPLILTTSRTKLQDWCHPLLRICFVSLSDHFSVLREIPLVLCKKDWCIHRFAWMLTRKSTNKQSKIHLNLRSTTELPSPD
jgi:hypothetical protein